MSNFSINAAIRLQAPQNVNAVVNNIRRQLQGITASVNISVPPQAQKQLANVNKSFVQTTKAAKSAQNAVTNFGEQAALAGKRFIAFSVAGGAFIKLTGALKIGISEAIAFEREMNKVSQATGSSSKSIKAISTEITRLSTGFGVSSTKLSKAALVLAQAGLSAKDTKKSLEALAKSDLAPTFEDITDTTEGAIAMFQQFGVSADNLESKLSSINAVAAKFAVESGDIVTAVRRTGGAFAAAGGNLNQLMALFTSVRATTRESAESIATGFRTIFTRLQRVRTQSFLKTVGIDLLDEGQFAGPYEAIRRLSTALKNLPGTDPRFAQIIEELGGFRQISKVIPLIQQFGTAEKALGVAMAGTTSLSDDAATAQKSLAIQIQKTREEFTAMIRKFTDNSAFKGVIKMALSLASALVKIMESLEPLAPMLAVLAGVGLGRAVGPFIKGFKQKGGLGLFAGGGIVPGTGNRDTVPAMLTPGEYVLRKNAVKALGLRSGGRVQKFAKAGEVKPRYESLGVGTDLSTIPGLTTKQGLSKGVGAIFLRTGAFDTTSAQEQSGIFEKGIFNVQTPQGQIAVPFTAGSFSKSFYKKFEGRIQKHLSLLTNKLGKETATELGAQQVSKIGKDTLAPNFASIVGGLFEGAISTLGPPFTSDQATFDFPQGLQGKTNNWAGGNALSTIPVDAKRTWGKSAKDSLIRKIQAVATDPSVLNIPARIPWKSGENIPPQLREILNKKRLNVSESAEWLESQGYNVGKVIPYDPKTNPGATQFIHRASGGLVPALLTPGEAVIDKRTASSIGISTLNRLNHADKFAGGGMAGFKPTLTKRGIAPGNVGHKKQWLQQRLAFLKQGKNLNILSPMELKELAKLQSQMTMVGSYRQARFGKRLGFARGGAVGRIRRMAGGGSSGFGNIGMAGFAFSGISALISTFNGIGESGQKLLNILTGVGAQFAILRATISSVGGNFKKLDVMTNLKGAALQRREGIKAQLPELRQQVKDQKNVFKGIAKFVDTKEKMGIPIEQKDVDLLLGAEKNINIAKGKLGVTEKQLSRNTKYINLLDAASKGLDKFNVGIIAAAAGATALGGYLTETGKAQLEAGTGGEDQYRAGKVLSGAGTMAGMGAAIGSVFGPFGIAIGGVTGAIIGFTKGLWDANKEIQNIKAMREFNQSIEKTGRILGDLGSGKTTFGIASTQVGSQTSQIRRILGNNKMSAATRQDVLAGAKSQLEGFNMYLGEAAKGARTFDEFISRAGQDTFNLVADLSNIPSYELTEQWKKTIDSNEKARIAQSKLVIVQDEYANRMRRMIDIGQAFESTNILMQKFGSSMDNMIGVIEGNIGSIKMMDESTLLSNPEKFFDPRRFAEILARDVINSPALSIGGVGAAMGADVQAAAQATKDLPNVLLGLRDNLATFEQDNAIEKLLEQFDKAPAFVKNSLEQAARNIIGGEGKEATLIEKIRTDLPGALKEFGSALQPILDMGAFISKSTTDEINRRLNYVDKFAQLTNKEIELRNKGLDILAQGEDLRARAQNRPPNLALLQQLDEQKQRNLLGINAGLANDPIRIGMELRAAENRLMVKQQQLQQQGLRGSEQLVVQIGQEQAQINSLTSTLEFLSDVSSRTAITMQRIDREQANIKPRTDLGDRFVFAESMGELRDLAKTLQAGRTLAATGNINLIQPDIRGDVKQLLEDFRDTAVDAFGGLTGRDVLAKTRFRSAKQANMSDEEAFNFAWETSGPLEKMTSVLNQQISVAEVANDILANNIANKLVDLRMVFEKSMASFNVNMGGMLTTLGQQQLQQQDQKDKQAQERISRSKGSLAAISGSLGLDAEGVQARVVGEKMPLIKKALQEQEAARQLSDYINTERSGVANRINIRTSKFGSADVLARFKRENPESAEVSWAERQNMIAQERQRIADLSKNNAEVLGTFDDYVRKNDTTGVGKAYYGKMAEILTGASDAARLRAEGLVGVGGPTQQLLAESGIGQDIIDKIGQNMAAYEQMFAQIVDKGTISELDAQLQNLENNVKMYSEQFGELAYQQQIRTAEYQNTITQIQQENLIRAREAQARAEAAAQIANDAVMAAQNENLRRWGIVAPPQRNATGGMISGSGSGDKVPALLEPGEFVLNRNAVAAVGAGRLSNINSKFGRFRKGGRVHMATGGGVGGMDYASITLLDRVVRNFGKQIDRFTSMANSMNGLNITLTANHRVEVIFNGLQVLTGLKKSIQELAISEANKVLLRYTQNNNMPQP